MGFFESIGKWIDQRRNPQAVTAVVEPPAEVPPRQVKRPLMIARLQQSDEDDDTTLQFLTYGWSRGHFTELSHPVYQMIRDLTDTPESGIERNWKVNIHRIKFGENQMVKLIEITHVDGFEFDEDRKIAIYFPPSDEFTYVSPMFGGPTADFLQSMQELAMKLSSRVTCIESAVDGTAVVVFKTWSDDWSSAQVIENYKTSLADET